MFGELRAGGDGPPTYSDEDILAIWEDARPFVEAGLTDYDDAVRREALYLVRKRADGRSIPALIKVLFHRDQERLETKGMAGIILEELGDPSAIIPLYEAGFKQLHKDKELGDRLKSRARIIVTQPRNRYIWLYDIASVGNRERRALAMARLRHFYELQIFPYFLKEMRSGVKERIDHAADILWAHCHSGLDDLTEKTHDQLSTWWRKHEHIYEHPEEHIPWEPPDTEPDKEEQEGPNEVQQELPQSKLF